MPDELLSYKAEDEKREPKRLTFNRQFREFRIPGNSGDSISAIPGTVYLLKDILESEKENKKLKGQNT